MAPKLLKEFVIRCSIGEFVDSFWLDRGWYERFLSEKLLDISVEIGEWGPNTVKPENAFTRKVKSYHPSKISFPGLPSHAESHKTQTYDLVDKGNFRTLTIKETNAFRGIPYADYFTVNTEWIVASGSNGSRECSVKIFLDFNFMKSTWLQGTIESNTRAELLTVYELWYVSAEEHLINGSFSEEASVNLDRLPSSNKYGSKDMEAGDNLRDETETANIHHSNARAALHGLSLDTSDSRSNYESDDEMQFYDCEDSRDEYRDDSDFRTERHRLLPPPNSGRGPNTPERLRMQYSEPSHSGGEPSSVKDMAVTVVETAFVLAEFSYWKVHRIYTHDLRVLFDVEPRDVLIRICNSFLPGWHSPVLLSPDLYGPFVAVLMLPQILLLSMGVTRHGCNQSALLGNAVVVSLCLWIGLSSLYRILAFVIAPTLEIKHCLSITGYSFFAWNLALLLSYPLESYQETLGVPVFIPLALFGLPSSIAQGCMFWEHTPASSLTLQPAAFPSSLQQCASQHIRCLQKVAWAIPKIIAFIVVAGTHYQFLWYVARVYMPGKKEMCQLSALVQPEKYADILLQKELRKYALMLLGGKNPY